MWMTGYERFFTAMVNIVRASDGATDTGACRRANNCTGNRTRTLTTSEGECTAADFYRSSRGNPRA